MTNIFASSTIGAQRFQLIALLCTLFGLFYYSPSLEMLLLVLTGYFIYGCLGIVVTFHRLLTHGSYETNKYLSRLFSIFGCFAGTGSPIAWVAIHINHHLKSDKEGDPHSPWSKGFKIFTLDYEHEVDKNTKWRMRHLITDKFQQALHRYYFLIMFAYGFLLFLLGGFYLLTFFFLAPALVTGLMSNVVNYVGHMPHWFGSSRTYNLADKSANNWLWAIPSWGEAWHNNHHRYPRRSYFGDKWYQIDISGFIIKLIRKKSDSYVRE